LFTYALEPTRMHIPLLAICVTSDKSSPGLELLDTFLKVHHRRYEEGSGSHQRYNDTPYSEPDEQAEAVRDPPLRLMRMVNTRP